MGRLWFYYSVTPIQKVYAVICVDPDATKLSFSEEFEIGGEVMLNKPTVLKNGEWWFPSAVWGVGLMDPSPELKDVYKVLDQRAVERKAFCVVSMDEGLHFDKRGGAQASATDRCYDEHMFLEMDEGVQMFIRTHYGIGKSFSVDGGNTWTEVENTGIFSPDTRFFIRRLQSGNVLLISHRQSENPETPRLRTNLTAFISKDEGKTWQGGLLLDERAHVSYPDGQEHDGNIYVVYDRDRRGVGEILLAKFTEEDVLKGKLQSGGYLKKIISAIKKDE